MIKERKKGIKRNPDNRGREQRAGMKREVNTISNIQQFSFFESANEEDIITRNARDYFKYFICGSLIITWN